MGQSIFSTYTQGENRVTSSIIQVLKNLPINVVEHFLRMFSESDVKEFFHFTNQVKGVGSKPDAGISANFNLLFETKMVPNSIQNKQLSEHLKLVKDNSAILVYLTPDQTKPKVLDDKKVVWKSFQDLHDLITELMNEPTLILSERDQFLLRNLQDLFSESELLSKINEVTVVAARKAWPDYNDHGVYVCQAGRSFRPTPFLGFYAEGKIQKHIAKIHKRMDGFVFSDESFDKNPDLLKNPKLKEKLTKWLTANQWAKNDTLQVFDLSTIDDTETEILQNSIKNDLTNSSEQGYAYTQGQRYVLLSKLKSAKTTTDLKE